MSEPYTTIGPKYIMLTKEIEVPMMEPLRCYQGKMGQCPRHPRVEGDGEAWGSWNTLSLNGVMRTKYEKKQGRQLFIDILMTFVCSHYFFRDRFQNE